MHLAEDSREEQLRLFLIVTDYFDQFAHEFRVLDNGFLLKGLPEVVLHLSKEILIVALERLWTTHATKASHSHTHHHLLYLVDILHASKLLIRVCLEHLVIAKIEGFRDLKYCVKVSDYLFLQLINKVHCYDPLLGIEM